MVDLNLKELAQVCADSGDPEFILGLLKRFSERNRKLDRMVLDVVRKESRISAIKFYRDQTGDSLSDSKFAVDVIIADNVSQQVQG